MDENSRERELAWLSSVSEKELFTRVGRELLGDGIGFNARDVERAAQFARDWFETRVDVFRAAVCTDPAVRDLGGNLNFDVLTIAPLLLAHLDGDQLLAFLVTGIILRRGIAEFCDLPR